MKSLRSLLFGLLLFYPLISPARDLSDLVLAPGQFSEIATPHGVAIVVGNGALIGVADHGSKIRVTGKKPGETQLRIDSETVKVSIVTPALANLYRKLAVVVASKRGLRLSLEDKTIWVRGRLLRWEDWQDLADASMSGGVPYRFAAELDAALELKAQAELQAKIRKASLPLTSLVVKGAASALVPIAPADLAKRVGEVISPYGFLVETSAAALSLEPMVRVRIVVAEIRREKTLAYGVKWPSAISAQLLPSPQLASGESIGLDISALETKGLGKILASPTLLCRSGKEATFVAGGEIPIKIANLARTDVIWKQYGVVLKIHPLADFSGRMSIALETEVSELDDAHKVDGIPGILSNRIESHFDLASSRTIALSGLIKSRQSETSSGLPGLSSIPILGPLFSSKEFRDDKTELVVFVTPDIAKPDESVL